MDKILTLSDIIEAAIQTIKGTEKGAELVKAKILPDDLIRHDGVFSTKANRIFRDVVIVAAIESEAEDENALLKCFSLDIGQYNAIKRNLESMRRRGHKEFSDILESMTRCWMCSHKKSDF